MGRLTFVDSDVLIAAATGRGDVAVQALSIRDDPERTFASSPFVELEVLPKAQFGQVQSTFASFHSGGRSHGCLSPRLRSVGHQSS
jgi:hypothetical protein